MMPIGPLTLAQLALKRNGCRLAALGRSAAALGRSGAISWRQRGAARRPGGDKVRYFVWKVRGALNLAMMRCGIMIAVLEFGSLPDQGAGT